MFTEVSLRVCVELATGGTEHKIICYSLYLV